MNELEDNDVRDKRERLVACVLSGNSKMYFGKEYTEQQINEMDCNSINTLLNGYKSITWSNRNSNCWSNGEKIMTFNTGNAKGTDHCIIGDIGKTTIKSHLIGCIGEIISFYRSFTDTETLYIHKYLMKKQGI